MPTSLLLALPPGLELTQLALTAAGLTVSVCSTAPATACPVCGHLASRIHSRYQRTVADLPCAGRRVQLHLHARKFFCDTVACPRRIFTERLLPFVQPWARMTTRLCQAIEVVGLATCGELGARLGKRLGIQTSPTTILRRVMAVPTPPPAPVSALGIDDFALRCSRTYGTILVDLTRHQAIDLLPDRHAEPAAASRQQHPEIDRVSRDRAGNYAAAVRQGAPQAIQIADRFHLLKNLTEAVEKALARCRAEWRRGPATNDRAEVPMPEAPPPPLVTTDGQPYSAHQTERYERYQQAVSLRQQGMTINEIAHRVGLGKRTVQSWLAHDTYPETHYHTRRHRSRFDAYETYVRQRWDEGVHNIQQLWREIKVQGYPHSSRALRDHLEPLHARGNTALPAASALDRVSAKEAVWLFVRASDALEEQERAALATIRQASTTADRLYPLVQEFVQIMRTRSGERLEDWLSQARACHIRELNRFVACLERDQAAVLAGLTRPESNDHVAYCTSSLGSRSL